MQLAGNEGGGPGSVRLASAAGRWVLAVAVLGEAMVLLEATVVNVALPSIGRDLHADVAGLQWTLDGYVLTLAALVLAAGSLSDIYGRRRVFTLGTAVFVAAQFPPADRKGAVTSGPQNASCGRVRRLPVPAGRGAPPASPGHLYTHAGSPSDAPGTRGEPGNLTGSRLRRLRCRLRRPPGPAGHASKQADPCHATGS